MPRGFMVIVVLLTVLVPTAVEAKRTDDARWDERTVIVVENRAGPEWNQAIRFSVTSWQKAFPRLTLRIVNKPAKPCRQETGKIIICEVAPNDQFGGHANWRTQGHEILSARIRMTHIVWDGVPMWDDRISMADMAILCHELGHALGLLHNGHPETSCVAPGSTRITPGAYDRTSLKLLYKREGKGWP